MGRGQWRRQQKPCCRKGQRVSRGSPAGVARKPEHGCPVPHKLKYAKIQNSRQQSCCRSETTTESASSSRSGAERLQQLRQGESARKVEEEILAHLSARRMERTSRPQHSEPGAACAAAGCRLVGFRQLAGSGLGSALLPELQTLIAARDTVSPDLLKEAPHLPAPSCGSLALSALSQCENANFQRPLPTPSSHPAMGGPSKTETLLTARRT